MNLQLFKIINSWAGHISWLDRFMIFSAEWLGYFLVLFLFVPVLMTYFIRNSWLRGKLRYFILEMSYYKNMLLVSLGSAVISRFILAEAIRYIYPHPRPFLVLQNINQLVGHEASSSLPSGHATFYFALGTGVYLYNKKLGTWYLLGAGLISFARIYVGVHWPFDVLAGASLGIIVALGLYRFKK